MNKNDRKQYSKPHLRVIELDTADVMAGGCKNVEKTIPPYPPLVAQCGIGGSKCFESGS